MTKRKPKVTVREIAPGILETSSNRAWFTNTFIEILPGASVEDRNQLLRGLGPTGLKDCVRGNMEWAKHFLHERNLDLKVDPTNPFPSGIEIVSKMSSLGYDPLAPETQAAKLFYAGASILKTTNEQESLIWTGIDFGQAFLRLVHYERLTKSQSEHAKLDRSPEQKAVAAELVALYPDKSATYIIEQISNLPHHRPPNKSDRGIGRLAEGNVGKYKIWPVGNRIHIYNTESPDEIGRAKSTFLDWLRQAKRQTNKK